MAWYYGTYSCGHEGRVQVYGPSKDRQWKADSEFGKVCPDCYKEFLAQKREEETKKAMELAKAMDLPPLQGTEKQVAWAEKIRQNLISWFDKLTELDVEYFPREYEGYQEIRKLTLDDMKVVKHFILENRTVATYYIDNRHNDVFAFIAREYKEALKTDEEKAEEELMQEIKAESTVYPDSAITNGVAEIMVETNKISVAFAKDETFRSIVKKLGYRWNGEVWEKEITETTGSAEERAAELGNKLLNAGIPICIMNQEVRERAIAGEYEPECKRWIFRRKDTDKLAINWTDRSDLYRKAITLPSAKWDSPSVLVKVEYYQEVEEFAELYGFRFTKAARDLIEKHKREKEKARVVTPAPAKETTEKDGLQDILQSEAVVLDDLKD